MTTTGLAARSRRMSSARSALVFSSSPSGWSRKCTVVIPSNFAAQRASSSSEPGELGRIDAGRDDTFFSGVRDHEVDLGTGVDPRVQRACARHFWVVGVSEDRHGPRRRKFEEGHDLFTARS